MKQNGTHYNKECFNFVSVVTEKDLTGLRLGCLH